MSKVFWKDSMRNEYDNTFQKKFRDKSEKEQFIKQHGFVEVGEVSNAHKKRVKDFVGWVKDERRRNPNFKPKEKYPD